MTNQEAVDFVRDRLEKDTKISDILEELFDTCIAPDTRFVKNLKILLYFKLKIVATGAAATI